MKLIDVDKLIQAIVNTPTEYKNKDVPLSTQLDGMAFRQIEILDLIKKQPIISQWHRITNRELTPEEKEDYAHNEWAYMIEGLPEYGVDVLVTDGINVWVDSFDIDDCVYLSGTDSEVDDIKAWQPLPEPWRGETK